jgi:AraC family transcriptional regulator
MAITSHRLASGPGWCVEDVVCTAGPQDRPYEERHATFSIAAVMEGSFQYRTQRGSAVLAPGALLLGNHGHCYECGHEHGVGDRCLAFHFAPEFLEAIVAAVPGARRLAFTVPRLPPLPALIPIIAAAEAARDAGDAGELESLALQLAGTVAATLADAGNSISAPARRYERRITAALRRIEALAHEPLSLDDLSRAAAMSPYHFLRTFRAVVGMTPHQFVLRTRLHRAAVQLRRSSHDVSAIALDCGFNDLSTFNRRFRQFTGKTPTTYRAAAAARR